MTLKELELGQSALVQNVGGEGELRRHLLDMGIVPGAKVKLIKYAPMGDPMEIKVSGYELSLRLADADKIQVLAISEKEAEKIDEKLENSVELTENQFMEHPGYGEDGKYHDKKNEKPLPEGTLLSFALAGNQNSGKTTLFNQLTGSNQHVGNFPGVTVDRKSGPIRGYSNTEITDLPGIYSLSPYTSEEIVSRNFIIDEKPKAIIDIVDATNIERNLNLTLQLMELNVPMVIALNMMDEVKGNGGSINVNAMESFLGVPVVPISASKNEGVDELIKHAVHIAKYQENNGRTDFCMADENGGAVHRCIHAVATLIQDHAEAAGIPLRFAATKLIEGDKKVIDALKLTQNELEGVEHLIVQMEEERGMDRLAAIADMRFAFIEKICKVSVRKPKESKERARSQRIDKVLTGKWTAIPVFIGIMALVFYLTFNVIGAWLQGLLESGIDALTGLVDTWLTAANVSEGFHSLVIDGIFAGVGGVLSFLPIIIVLFLFLSILEDSGYMARVAFVMDKLLRKIGLSGRSIVPLLIGFGCSVPAVMASRTMPSERDRKMTVLLTPFMSCTAKLPIYAFFTSVFFPEHAALVMIGLYVLGIVVAILVALVSKLSVFKGEAVPFIMELPNYRMPSAKNVALLLWDKAKDFLQRAFTIIFLATIVIWFLQSFDFRLNMVSDSQQSILASIAGFVAPVFKPLGFGDWRFVTALVGGFLAKEGVVSTFEVLFPTEAAMFAAFGGTDSVVTAGAAALLVFCLLYTPCAAAVSSIKRELGGKWAAFTVVFQCVIAWVVALIVRFIVLAIL